MSFSSQSNCDIRELLVLAVTLAILLAQDKSETEIGKMAAFFTILGDVLDLFAFQPGLFRCCQGLCASNPDVPEIPAECDPPAGDQPSK